MKQQQKPDAKEIRDHIDSLCQASFLDATHSWWPRFIYHFSNMDNAINILESGQMYSRSYCSKHGLMLTDNASQEIITGTKEKWMEYVRLYFRPRTPTQYRNEGYIPAGQRYQNAHCSVPIYFMFDAKQVLSLCGVCFSECSLARLNAHACSSAEEFKQIPFHLVYHDAPIDVNSQEGQNIIGHRNAEVIVPEKLNLKYLKYIWCRSEAEYQTLLSRLSGHTLYQWRDRIGSGKKGNLFYRRWLFVEQVELKNTGVVFRFNEPSQLCDPFPIRVEIIEETTGIVYTWENSSYRIPDNCKLEISLDNLQDSGCYIVKLLFDQQIMFMDKYRETEYVPF